MISSENLAKILSQNAAKFSAGSVLWEGERYETTVQ